MSDEFFAGYEIEPINPLWRLHSYLPVADAAALMAGYDPSQVGRCQSDTYFAQGFPNFWPAAYALTGAILNGELLAERDEIAEGKTRDGVFPVPRLGFDPRLARVKASDLKTWLRSKSQKTGYFFDDIEQPSNTQATENQATEGGRAEQDPTDIGDAARYATSYRGDKLIPILNLWEQVAQVLGISLKQSSDFVENQIRSRRMFVFADREETGLWHPIEGERVERWLLDMWSSGESHDWALPVLQSQGWTCLRVTIADAARVVAEAQRIHDAEPPASAGDKTERDNEASRWPWGSIATKHSGDPKANGVRTDQIFGEQGQPDPLDPNHPRYAYKLAAALKAWIALEGIDDKAPIPAITTWLEQRASELGLLKDDQSLNRLGIDECAKVANWRPKGGATKTPNQE